MPSKPFRPGFEAAASQPFTFLGVKYARRERFPYRDLGIIELDLRGLWMGDRVEFTDEPYRIATPQATPAKSGRPQQPNPLLQPPRR